MSRGDAPAISPPESTMASPMRLPKLRAQDVPSVASSIASLPYRGSSASVSSLFASTTTPTGSRSVSPSGTGTPSRMTSSSIFAGTPNEGRQPLPVDSPEDPRYLIMQAFVPHVAVHTSVDTHELVKEKGFDGGLWELLRPFGESIQGKVTVRDSVGAGRTWDDFGVRFVQLGDGLELPDGSNGARKSTDGKPFSPDDRALPDHVITQRARTGGDITAIEQLVARHLSHAEEYTALDGEDYLNFRDARTRSSEGTSPFYTLYLRRLLSGIPLSAHETFAHPVACVIAISSRNKNPIETLRQLYDESSHGEKRLPTWASSEYLRYYVLVHDEEKDDITKSMTLFDQMKRHFGLHCHLLRLRSSHCAASDDDSVRLIRPEWLSAREEIHDIQEREILEDIEDSYPSLYESDTTALRTFIREMVTQSIIPSMERNIATWNDQVASRRRGISGRFMNLSRKWTGFGGSSRTTSSATGGSSNYDSLLGFYRPDAPEAVMRKLADYAFMLRDWKLAQSTYDLLRSDFSNDKAWKYHAAANEMAAITSLMIPQAMTSKVRAETIDQWLETASYSYSTRCGANYGTLRCLALGMELLRLRGGSATEAAARWGSKILELNIVGVVGNALIKERVAACYASKKGSGTELWGARTRKSALWTILAADSWLTLGKVQQSQRCLMQARAKYALLSNKDSLSKFRQANVFLEGLQREVQLALYPESGIEGPGGEDLIDTSVEESQAFEARPHRRSLIGAAGPALSDLGTAPLKGLDEEADTSKTLQFE